MCDILPVIPECQIEENESENGNNALQDTFQYDRQPGSDVSTDPMYHNFEQLVGSMLEEREKLTNRLKDAEDRASQLRLELSSSERRNDILSKQIDDSFSKEISVFVRDIARLKEALNDHKEEIEDLKSERRNTQTLLEHLELLVSRHEKSLRLTVAKRQQLQQVNNVQQNVNFAPAVSSEIEILEVLRSLFAHHKALDEKIRNKLKQSQARCFYLEDQLDKATQKETHQNDSNFISQSLSEEPVEKISSYVQTENESNNRNDRDDIQILREEREHLRCANKAANDRCSQLENRVSQLDERNLNLQRESNAIHDTIGKLEAQLSSKELALKQIEEKYSVLKNRFDIVSQRIQSTSQSDVTQSLEKCPSMEQLQGILVELEDLQAELSTCKQREALKEEHNARLTATVEKLLCDSEQKTNAYLHERLQILQDKNRLVSECEKMRRRIDECNSHKATLLEQISRCNGKGRLAYLNSPNWLCEQDDTSNGFDYDAIETSLAQSNGNVVKNVHSAFGASRDPSIESLKTNVSMCDLDRSDDGNNTVSRHDSSVKLPFDLQDENREVETLAAKLQYQLDIINDEMRRIEYAKNEADRKFEQLEHQMHKPSVHDKQGSISSSPPDLTIHRSNPILFNSDFRYGYNSSPSQPLGSPAQSYQSLLNSRQVTRNRCGRSNFDENGTKAQKYIMPDRECHTTLPKSNACDEFTCEGGVSKGASDGIAMVSRFDETDGYKSSRKTQKPYNSFRGSIGKFLRLYSTNTISKTSSDYEQSSMKRCVNSLESSSRGTPDACNINLVSQAELDRPLLSMEFNKRITRKQELLDRLLYERVPFSEWDTTSVVAWLELWVGMPAWYVAACRANVKSGAIMASLSDGEIQREIGIANPLHRLKLRLAISEIVDYTLAPRNDRNPSCYLRTISAFKEMNHEWVGNQWLSSLGLGQYRSSFMSNLVDARMLPYLTKRDIRNVLKLVDNAHRTSLNCGISLLRRIDFNLIELNDRRQKCIDSDTDVMVWTNDRIRRWLQSIELSDWLTHLSESGLHGALLMLDNTFDAKEFACRLQIPSSYVQVRQTLQVHFERLVSKNILDCRSIRKSTLAPSPISSDYEGLLDGR